MAGRSKWILPAARCQPGVGVCLPGAKVLANNLCVLGWLASSSILHPSHLHRPFLTVLGCVCVCRRAYPRVSLAPCTYRHRYGWPLRCSGCASVCSVTPLQLLGSYCAQGGILSQNLLFFNPRLGLPLCGCALSAISAAPMEHPYHLIPNQETRAAFFTSGVILSWRLNRRSCESAQDEQKCIPHVH